MEQYMWAIWLGIFVIALIIEACTSELVSIWFSMGALIALILSVIPGVAWWIQLIVFIVISAATLICLRPLASKLLKRNMVRSNVDEMVGKKGIMIKEYDELSRGEVKINGVIWTAIDADEKTPIEQGKKVEVIAIEGNKLIVREIK